MMTNVSFNLVLLLLTLLLLIRERDSSSSERDGLQASSCPNGCSFQGACLLKEHYGSVGVCSCFPGFTGPDCSQRLCPAAKAWTDFPVANNLAHNNYTECSNMGTCDRTTGNCKCRYGFGGPACDVLLCPRGPSHSMSPEGTLVPCNGNGRCISLRQAAVTQDYINFSNYTVYTDWDADMIHGCACQKGWEGPACDRRSCPKGVDPLVGAVNEVQLIDCKCTTCSGGMYLRFRGKETAYIPYDASRQLIRYHLERLSTVDRVSVTFLKQTKLCSSAGSVARIEFRLPKGDLETMALRTQGSLAGTISVIAGGQYSSVLNSEKSNDGTHKYSECSDRGECDYSTGVCSCYPGFRSSNGGGAIGTRGDCGYQQTVNITYGLRKHEYNESMPNQWQGIEAVIQNTSCPFTEYGGDCNGKGTCVSATKTCVCDYGYEGPRCDRKSCGKAQTWFGDVGPLHSHWSVCGGIGECDYVTGKCVRCGGDWGVFAGDRCEYMTCPQNGLAGACSGQGQCLSMKNLAAVAYTSKKELSTFTYAAAWDSNMIYGCACYRAPSVDNFFYDMLDAPDMRIPNAIDPTRFFYRGPYANAATDFTGYMCTSARCPHGDNPATRDGQNEVQKMVCTANKGNFSVVFRENVTEAIDFNTSAAGFEYALQKLHTISRVSVTIEGSGYYKLPDSICHSSGNLSVYIEFLSEFGDLPLLKTSNSQLLIKATGAGGSVAFTEYQRGTKEDVECSAQGTCNETSGVCKCLPGYRSSNGTIDFPGNRGDCTFKNRFDGF